MIYLMIIVSIITKSDLSTS